MAGVDGEEEYALLHYILCITNESISLLEAAREAVLCPPPTGLPPLGVGLYHGHPRSMEQEVHQGAPHLLGGGSRVHLLVQGLREGTHARVLTPLREDAVSVLFPFLPVGAPLLHEECHRPVAAVGIVGAHRLEGGEYRLIVALFLVTGAFEGSAGHRYVKSALLGAEPRA